MKRSISLVIALAYLSLGFWSCKTFEGASVTAKPDPIEVHADSVKYSVRVTILPKNKLKKGGVYYGEAKIANRTQRRVTISSDKYPDLKNTGMDTTIKLSRPYFDDMDGKSLYAVQSYERRGKTFELPNLEDIAKCCITTSRLVKDNDQYIFSQHDYVKEVPLNLRAKFQFPRDVFEIQEGDYEKDEIKKIGDFIAKKYTATKITIVGFASPEGPFERNVNLSVNRSKEVKKWLIDKLKEGGYQEYLDTNFFDISYTHEDWEGFKSKVSSLSYSADIKSQILDIVSAGLSEDEKEKQVMALVGGKRKVEDILSPLRRATIRLEGFEPRKTDEQIDKIASDFIAGSLSGEIRDKFDKEEWLYAVSRVEDPKGKKALLEEFRKKYTSDHRAFNDLGLIAAMDGEMDKAYDYLEQADKLRAGDFAIKNNLGAVYKKDKNFKQAKQMLEASLSAKNSPEANFNLGVIYERMARYNLASEKFAEASELPYSKFNLGLCKLLREDLAGAKAGLTDAIKEDKEDALAYYVLAIAGARASDASTMTVNLKKACQLDGKYKTKAKSDLEFRKYYNSAEFKAATN